MDHSDSETEVGSTTTVGSFLQPWEKEAGPGIFKGFDWSTVKDNDCRYGLIGDLGSVLARAGLADLYDYNGLPDQLKRYKTHKTRALILQNVGYLRAKQLQDSMISRPKTAYLWLLLKTDAFQDCTCRRLTKNGGIERLGKLSLYQETEKGGCAYCQLVLDIVNTYKPGWTCPSMSSMGTQKHGAEGIERKTILVEMGPDGIAKVFLNEARMSTGQFEFFIQPSM